MKMFFNGLAVYVGVGICCSVRKFFGLKKVAEHFERKYPEAHQMSMEENFYRRTGLNRICNSADIKVKFRDLLVIYHPDKGGNKEKFQQIRMMENILKNERDLYDFYLIYHHEPITKILMFTGYTMLWPIGVFRDIISYFSR